MELKISRPCPCRAGRFASSQSGASAKEQRSSAAVCRRKKTSAARSKRSSRGRSSAQMQALSQSRSSRSARLRGQRSSPVRVRTGCGRFQPAGASAGRPSCSTKRHVWGNWSPTRFRPADAPSSTRWNGRQRCPNSTAAANIQATLRLTSLVWTMPSRTRSQSSAGARFRNAVAAPPGSPPEPPQLGQTAASSRDSPRRADKWRQANSRCAASQATAKRRSRRPRARAARLRTRASVPRNKRAGLPTPRGTVTAGRQPVIRTSPGRCRRP